MSKRIICLCYDPYPGPEWEAIFEHADDVYAVVLNVKSGVGDELDPVYVAMRERFRAAGILCLGYCSTRYGERPIAGVASEINDWFVRYKVDGIFLDEQHSGAEKLPYYKRLRGSIGSALMVTNPGVVPADEYYQVADVICDAETSQASYLEKSFSVRAGAKRYQIVFSVTDAYRVMVMEAADRNGADYLYLTSAVPAPGASGPEFNIPETIWPKLEAPTPAPAPVPTPAPAPPEDPNWSSLTNQQTMRALDGDPNSTVKYLVELATQRMAELKRLRAQVATVRLSAVPDDQLIEEFRARLARRPEA